MSPFSGVDEGTVIAVVSGIVTFVGFVIAGVRKGLKTLKDAHLTPDGKAQIAAGMLMEAQSLREWTDSNREVTHAINRLIDTLRDHSRGLDDHEDELKDMHRTLNELVRKLG